MCSLRTLLSYPRLLLLFFNNPATPEIHTLSLHDALPISGAGHRPQFRVARLARENDASGIHRRDRRIRDVIDNARVRYRRSEEHTSELQSHSDLVCRLLLEKKKKTKHTTAPQDAHR